MSNIVSANPSVQLINGKATTTSLQVAEVFGKQHAHVMRDIRSILAELPEADRLSNFGETVVERENPSGGAPIASPAYEITRDGFTLLAMGFTGKKALHWKLSYIAAFNAMEKSLLAQSTYSVNSTDTLTLEQADQLRDTLRTAADTMLSQDAAKFMISGWSKLKTHFGVKYRQIPQHKFNDALAIVARHVAAAKPKALPPQPKSLPAVVDELQTRINKRAWELSHATYEIYRKRMNNETLVTSGCTHPDNWVPQECENEVLESIECVAGMMTAFANTLRNRGRYLGDMIGVDFDEAVKKFRPETKA